MANLCSVYLLKNFPICDYSNVFYHNTEHDSLAYTVAQFMNYCTQTSGVDTFLNISSVDLTNCYFKVEIPYKTANEYNYCIIYVQNEDKYYLAFIKSVTWNSNLVVATFNFEIDVFHTYIKQVKFEKCFVEREHVSNDSYGTHILDEGIGVSNYFNYNVNDIDTTSNYVPVVAISDTSLLRKGTTRNGDLIPDIVNVNEYEKTICLVAPNSDTVIDPQIGINGILAFTSFINMMYYQNKGQSIVAMYYMPSEFISTNFDVCSYDPNLPDMGTDEPRQPLYCTKNVVTAQTIHSVTHAKPTIDSSTHHITGLSSYSNVEINNNKSLIYPFCFAEFSNNNGGKLQMKYELSTASNHNAVINWISSMCHSGKPYLFAHNYDGVIDNYNYSLTALENPDLPYIHNSYGAYISSQRNALTNSLEYIKKDKDVAMFNNLIDTTQTQTQQTATMLTSGIASGIMGGNVGGTASAIGSGLMNLMQSEVDYRQQNNNISYSATKSRDSVDARLRDAKTMGNTASGVACGNSLLAIDSFGFKRYTCIASKEELQTIDDYFSRYGYKVNQYKKPNLKGRPLFNYVKCSEVNITGDIPTEYIDILKAILSQGVTLWHDMSHFFDFDFKANSII